MAQQQFPVTVAAGYAEGTKSAITLRHTGRTDVSVTSEQLFLRHQSDDGPGKAQYSVSVPSKGNSVLKASANAAKDVDCVLVYNPSSGGYEIHPLAFDLRITGSQSGGLSTAPNERSDNTTNVKQPQSENASAKR